MGERPTHPELLDWLTDEFVAGGWSMKQMHRLMMTSETYQQSSDFRETSNQKDPFNRLLWRLSAAASGRGGYPGLSLASRGSVEPGNRRQERLSAAASQHAGTARRVGAVPKTPLIKTAAAFTCLSDGTHAIPCCGFTICPTLT